MRHIVWRFAIGLLAAFSSFGVATAAPVLISYAAIVTSNSGDATDGVVPPGTVVTVQIQVDSESLLTGAFLPATGSADTAGVTDMTLTVDSAGSGQIISVPGATARVYSFRGDGPSFEADGDPPSNDIWEWTSASLYLPLGADLDGLLALTLGDVNQLIAAFGSVTLLTFTHRPQPNSFVFERASTSTLYEFSIELASVPEPAPAPLLALTAAVLVTRRFCLRAATRRNPSG